MFRKRFFTVQRSSLDFFRSGPTTLSSHGRKARKIERDMNKKRERERERERERDRERERERVRESQRDIKKV